MLRPVTSSLLLTLCFSLCPFPEYFPTGSLILFFFLHLSFTDHIILLLLFHNLNLTLLFLFMPFPLSQPSIPLFSPSFFYLCIFYLSIFCKLAGLVRHRVSLFGKNPAWWPDCTFHFFTASSPFSLMFYIISTFIPNSSTYLLWVLFGFSFFLILSFFLFLWVVV